ncbi:epimerase [Telmatobacter sp. DSM 110680]|uniref:Epimerase n=1 Tax=Telmatobacter sp. DSM 110680 TaxID=3036704 RepID=A0AAU7DKU1_9BACT
MLKHVKVLIFGATGMIGRGVLLECLRDTNVELVVTVGRTAVGIKDGKVREIVLPDLLNYSGMEQSLAGFDACFFSLGVASAGMTEADYSRVTYQYTMVAAQILSRLNPDLTFIFVSGSGTDSSKKGRVMWARVKGRTENALLNLPFKAYMFRPGFIQPMDGIQSKTPLYRRFYTILGPLFPLLRKMFPNQVLSTRQLGQAMLNVARRGYPKYVLEARDIRAAADPEP